MTQPFTGLGLSPKSFRSLQKPRAQAHGQIKDISMATGRDLRLMTTEGVFSECIESKEYTRSVKESKDQQVHRQSEITQGHRTTAQ